MKKAGESFVLWSPDGAWLQTTDWNGVMKLDDLGRLSLASVEKFCYLRGVRLVMREDRPILTEAPLLGRVP